MTASTQQTGIDELLSALTEVREAAEIELPVGDRGSDRAVARRLSR